MSLFYVLFHWIQVYSSFYEYLFQIKERFPRLVIIILLAEFCERFSYSGMRGKKCQFVFFHGSIQENPKLQYPKSFDPQLSYTFTEMFVTLSFTLKREETWLSFPFYLIVSNSQLYKLCVDYALQKFAHNSISKRPETSGFMKSLMDFEFSEFFFCFVAFLTLYLRSKLGYSDDGATETYHIFSTFVYVFPIIGGILADNYLGKFRYVWLCVST